LRHRRRDAGYNGPGKAFGLRRADFLSPSLRERRRFVRQLELRAGSVVLHVVRQVVRARQRLSCHVDLASGQRPAGRQQQSTGYRGPRRTLQFQSAHSFHASRNGSFTKRLKGQQSRAAPAPRGKPYNRYRRHNRQTFADLKEFEATSGSTAF
jgi:hypothetical protein